MGIGFLVIFVLGFRMGWVQGFRKVGSSQHTMGGPKGPTHGPSEVQTVLQPQGLGACILQEALDFLPEDGRRMFCNSAQHSAAAQRVTLSLAAAILARRPAVRGVAASVLAAFC